jgi:hypothetical protein
MGRVTILISGAVVLVGALVVGLSVGGKIGTPESVQITDDMKSVYSSQSAKQVIGTDEGEKITMNIPKDGLSNFKIDAKGGSNIVTVDNQKDNSGLIMVGNGNNIVTIGGFGAEIVGGESSDLYNIRVLKDNALVSILDNGGNEDKVFIHEMTLEKSSFNRVNNDLYVLENDLPKIQIKDFFVSDDSIDFIYLDGIEFLAITFHKMFDDSNTNDIKEKKQMLITGLSIALFIVLVIMFINRDKFKKKQKSS